MTEEHWKTIPSFPLYQASSEGRIRRHPDHLWHCSGPFLAPGVTKKGYLNYVLRRDNRSVNVGGGPLVCEAFHGPKPSPDHEAAHEDGNPRNNRPDNLSWKTVSENHADKRRHGTHREGEAIPWACLKASQIPEIRSRLATGESCLTISRDMGVSEGAINGIRIGRNWKHAA